MRCAATLVCAALVASGCSHENRWVKGSESTELGPIVGSPTLPELYLADLGTQQLAVIDSRREEVVARYTVAGRIGDLAVNLDGSLVGVAAGSVIGILNTRSRRYSEHRLPFGLSGSVVSIAFHASNALFVAVNENPPGISPSTRVFVLGPLMTTVLTSFGEPTGIHSYYFPLLRTDNSGTHLYIGERGLSGLSLLFHWNVENAAAPVFVSRQRDSDLNFLKDMAVSTDSAHLFVASFSPDGLQAYLTPALSTMNLWPAEPDAVAVAVSAKRRTVFLAPAYPPSDLLYEFDDRRGEIVAKYTLRDDKTEFAETSERGVALADTKKVFVVYGRPPLDESCKERVKVVDLVRH